MRDPPQVCEVGVRRTSRPSRPHEWHLPSVRVHRSDTDPGTGSLAKSANGRDNSMLPAQPRPRAERILMPGGATEVTHFDQQTGGSPHETPPQPAPPQQGPPMGWSP